MVGERAKRWSSETGVGGSFEEYFRGQGEIVVDLGDTKTARESSSSALHKLNESLDLIKTFSREIVRGEEGQEVLKIPLSPGVINKLSYSTKRFLDLETQDGGTPGEVTFEYTGSLGHKIRSIYIERNMRRVCISWRNGIRVNWTHWQEVCEKDGWKVVSEEGLEIEEALNISQFEIFQLRSNRGSTS